MKIISHMYVCAIICWHYIWYFHQALEYYAENYSGIIGWGLSSNSIDRATYIFTRIMLVTLGIHDSPLWGVWRHQGTLISLRLHLMWKCFQQPSWPDKYNVSLSVLPWAHNSWFLFQCIWKSPPLAPCIRTSHPTLYKLNPWYCWSLKRVSWNPAVIATNAVNWESVAWGIKELQCPE